MADHVVLFYAKITDLLPAEEAWLKRTLAVLQTASRERGGAHTPFIKEFFEVRLVVDFKYSIRPVEGAAGPTISFSSLDDNGSPFQVALLVREFLRVFRPTASWSVVYSEFMTKPFDGCFTGGAYFVTREAVRGMNATDWCAQMHEGHERKFRKQA
jgi:hypothetical protein